MEPAPKKVLLVDDNARVRQALSLFFETLVDWVVVGEAKNGQEALDLCARLQPDVVIMDLLMPVMDGVTATRLIHQQFPAIRILVLTSATVETDVQAAMEAGASGFMLKYGSIRDLESALEKTIGLG